MASIVLSRDLSSADDGMHTWTMSFTQSGVTVSMPFPVTVSPFVAFSVTLSPASAALSDNAPAGTLLTTPTFAGTDGTPITFSAVDENNNPAPVTFNP